MNDDKPNLAECVCHGFWFCEGCGKVVQVEMDEVFRICPKCGARRVRFVAGIGSEQATSKQVPRGTSFHVEQTTL